MTVFRFSTLKCNFLTFYVEFSTDVCEFSTNFPRKMWNFQHRTIFIHKMRKVFNTSTLKNVENFLFFVV